VTSIHRRRAPRVAGLLLATALVLGACGNSGDDDDEGSDTTAGDDAAPLTGVPGVTDDEIRFAALGTITGNPTGACTLACFAHGIEAYFAYRNDEGGLFGRKLVLAETLDDELG
jgi:branched-chain amino acid transport system substrate-binding protein